MITSMDGCNLPSPHTIQLQVKAAPLPAQPGGDADPVLLASPSVVDQAQPMPIRTRSGLAPASSTTVDLLQVLQAAQGDLQVVHLSFDKFGRTIRGADRDIPGLPVLAQRGLHPVGQHGQVVLHPLQNYQC